MALHSQVTPIFISAVTVHYTSDLQWTVAKQGIALLTSVKSAIPPWGPAGHSQIEIWKNTYESEEN